MTLEIVGYSDELEKEWEDLCEIALNSTFLHSRKFFDLQKNKFDDQSLFVKYQDQFIGAIPFATDPANHKHLISHPGATFGGVIRDSRLRGNLIHEALEKVMSEFKARGYEQISIKHVPFIYQVQPTQDEEYSFWKLGAHISESRLTSTINLRNDFSFSSRRKRGIKVAKKNEVTIQSGSAHLEELWEIVYENLSARHNAKPVHNLEEIQRLEQTFPDNISVVVATYLGAVVAGSVLFKSQNVWHAQYIASNELGRELSALDLVFDYSIENAQISGANFFDFGTSNESNGMKLNEGLYTYKSEFGGGGVLHQYSTINL